MIDHMIDRGVAGFYICGSTGEGESLTLDERKQFAEATVSAAKGRVPVVVQAPRKITGVIAPRDIFFEEWFLTDQFGR